MTQDKPYIEDAERPNLSVDPNQSVGDTTVSELRDVLRSVGTTSTGKFHADVGDLKSAPDSAQIGGKHSKDATDKSSADIKSSNDHKLDVDHSNSNDSGVPSDGIVELLRRLADGRNSAR